MAPAPGCPGGGGSTTEGLGGVGRGGVGVDAGFNTAAPLMGRNSFAFGFRVEFFTWAAATETLSARSLLSGEGSSPLWGVPRCGPSGPVDWGLAGAGGADVGAAGEGVEIFLSVVCCRSWIEEGREGLGLGGAGEEEEEEDSVGGVELC